MHYTFAWFIYLVMIIFTCLGKNVSTVFISILYLAAIGITFKLRIDGSKYINSMTLDSKTNRGWTVLYVINENKTKINSATFMFN